MIELATRGVAVTGLATDRFDRFLRQVLEQRGAGDLRLAVVEHPIGGIRPKDATRRVTPEVLDQDVSALVGSVPT
jgi:hypothetical protein